MRYFLAIFVVLRRGGHGDPRLARQPIPQAAALYVPGHGAAAQAAAAEAERVFRERAQLAVAGAGNDCAEHADTDRRSGWCIRFEDAPVNTGRASGHHEFRGDARCRSRRSC